MYSKIISWHIGIFTTILLICILIEIIWLIYSYSHRIEVVGFFEYLGIVDKRSYFETYIEVYMRFVLIYIISSLIWPLADIACIIFITSLYFRHKVDKKK